MFKALTVLLLLSAAVNAQISKLSDAVVKDLDGNEISFKKFEGKCVLAINTASKCGFTEPNMKYLNELSKRHPDLVILAFPSNSFNQEPKSNSELKEWFFKTWNAKYNVFAPVDVKEHELYKFLIKQAGNKAVIWNYGKYVIEKDGITVERYGPQAGSFPGFQSIETHLQNCLNE